MSLTRNEGKAFLNALISLRGKLSQEQLILVNDEVSIQLMKTRGWL